MQILIKRRLISRMVFIAIVPLLSAVAAHAQAPAVPTQSQTTPAAIQPDAHPKQPANPDETTTDSSSPATPEQMRQAQIQDDTKKLYQLALELRTEVGKTYKQSLSLTVLRKAEELEKLSKKLRSEMNHDAVADAH